MEICLVAVFLRHHNLIYNFYHVRRIESEDGGWIIGCLILSLQGVLERTAEGEDIAASQVYLNACTMFQAEGLTYNTEQNNKTCAKMTKDIES